MTLTLCAAVVSVALVGTATAETLPSALAKAYLGNTTLNAGRAALRATDENVPRALSGYRPNVQVTADAGFTHLSGSVAGERSRGTLFRRPDGRSSESARISRS